MKIKERLKLQILKETQEYICQFIFNSQNINKSHNIIKGYKGGKKKLELTLIGGKNIMKYILLLNIIIQIFSNNNYQQILITNANEITLKVKDIGVNRILNAPSIITFYPHPSNIYIDDVETFDFNSEYEIKINSKNSLIKLEWDTIFNSTRYLLANCVNITEIN